MEGNKDFKRIVKKQEFLQTIAIVLVQNYKKQTTIILLLCKSSSHNVGYTNRHLGFAVLQSL